MQNILKETKFDWSRDKTEVVVQRRGIASLVAPAMVFGKTPASVPSAVRSRCVWPSIWDNSDSKYLSRRVRSR